MRDKEAHERPKMIVLDPIQGHIVLFCKGHYKKNQASQLEGLRKIWAIRCGLEYQYVEKGQSDEYIADELFRIIKQVAPIKAERMWEELHKQLARPDYQYRDLKAIEMTIMVYRSVLFGLQVREKFGDRYEWLIQFPKPKKQVFNRILRGNGRFDDYKLIAA